MASPRTSLAGARERFSFACSNAEPPNRRDREEFLSSVSVSRRHGVEKGTRIVTLRYLERLVYVTALSAIASARSMMAKPSRNSASVMHRGGFVKK